MNKNKQYSDNSSASNSISPKSALVPPTQPLPKKEDEIRANISTGAESKKSDSNPTL